MNMYNYQIERPKLFTEDGVTMFLKIRDNAHNLLKTAGAFDWVSVVRGVGGDTWLMLACVDRLVELGELRELTGSNVHGQDRVFVAGRG